MLQQSPQGDITLLGLPISFDGVRPALFACPAGDSAPHTEEIFAAPAARDRRASGESVRGIVPTALRARPRQGEDAMNVMQSMPEEAIQLSLGETYPEIRDLVRRICSDFPGSYWRKLDDEQAYPTRVCGRAHQSRSAGGADPRGYGGLGLPLRRRPRRSRKSTPAAATPAPAMPRCTSWGRCCVTAARAEARYLPEIAAGQVAAASLRGDRADDRHRYHEAQNPSRARRRPLRRQRPEGLDIAGAAVGSDAASGAHHAARSGEEKERRAFGIPGRYQVVARAAGSTSSRCRP